MDTAGGSGGDRFRDGIRGGSRHGGVRAHGDGALGAARRRTHHGRAGRPVHLLGITQVVNATEVHGIGYLTPTVCDGTAQWFAAELTTFGGVAFRRATSTWAASGYVEGGGGMQHVSVPPTRIRIQ